MKIIVKNKYLLRKRLSDKINLGTKYIKNYLDIELLLLRETSSMEW